MPVYSGPQSLKIMMRITNSESALQILFPNPHNSSSRQVTMTLFYRGAQRKIMRTHGDKAEIVSKAEPIALAFFLFPTTDLYFLNDIRQQCQK